MNLLHDVSNGARDITNVVVEIPKGSRNKFEYDKAAGVFRLDRVLYSPFFYPVDYGFVPRTWYLDDDPLDAMIYTREPSFTGCVVEIRVIGLFRMKDEKGIDDKIIGVPTGDPIFEGIKDITDLPSAFLDEVSHFFARYKDLEKGKSSEVVGWFDKKDAVKALRKGKQLYEKKFGKKKTKSKKKR